MLSYQYQTCDIRYIQKIRCDFYSKITSNNSIKNEYNTPMNKFL